MDNWIDIQFQGTRVVAPDRESLLTILQKISRISDFGPVAKDSTNAFFHYPYVSYEQWAATMKPRLLAEKILFLYSADNAQVTVGDKILATVGSTLSFWDVDTGAVMFLSGQGLGEDSGDKAVGKGITNGLKYPFMRAMLTSDREADEDDEDKAKRLAQQHSQTEGTPPVKRDESPEGKQAAGGESVEVRINKDALSSEQRQLYFGIKNHYDNVKDEEFEMALGFPLTDYKGDTKKGFQIIGAYLKKSGREWHEKKG